MAAYHPHSGPSPLWSWLTGVTPVAENLLWCHTTDGFRLKNLINTGTLSVNRCRVLDEDLLYFFYGRPAFRRDEDQQLRLTSKSPIVIVLKTELVANALRMFPFDSGAFQAGRYQNWIHPGMTLADFQLAQSPEAPQRCISAFFGSANKYLRLEGQKPSLPYAGEFEVESLVAILNDPDATTADDRRLAVELQLGLSVPFDDTTIAALVIPDELKVAKWMQEFLAGRGTRIEVIDYERATLRKAGDYQVLLEDKVKALQRQLGLIT
jgi:hypothetical protein